LGCSGRVAVGFCGADGKCRMVIKALGPDFIKRMGPKLMDESLHHENMRMMYCLILRYLRHVKCNERISYTQCWTEDQRQFVLDMREEGIRLAAQIRWYYPKLVRSLCFLCQSSGGRRGGIVYLKPCCNGDREKPYLAVLLEPAQIGERETLSQKGGCVSCLQATPYTNVITLTAPSALLRRIKQMPQSPYNGLLDINAEGLESGMRALHEGFVHSNQQAAFISGLHEQNLFNTTYLTMAMPTRDKTRALKRIKTAALLGFHFPRDERAAFDEAIDCCGYKISLVSLVVASAPPPFHANPCLFPSLRQRRCTTCSRTWT